MRRSFFASAVHQPLQKVWDEAKYLLPYLAYYYSRKQRIYLAFSRFLTFRSEANAVPNKKAINGLE